MGAAEPRYVLQSPGLVENCVGLYVPLLEFNQQRARGTLSDLVLPQRHWVLDPIERTNLKALDRAKRFYYRESIFFRGLPILFRHFLRASLPHDGHSAGRVLDFALLLQIL